MKLTKECCTRGKQKEKQHIVCKLGSLFHDYFIMRKYKSKTYKEGKPRKVGWYSVH